MNCKKYALGKCVLFTAPPSTAFRDRMSWGTYGLMGLWSLFRDRFFSLLVYRPNVHGSEDGSLRERRCERHTEDAETYWLPL